MRDIYETYYSKYCYPGTTVLKNKLNIMNIEKLQNRESVLSVGTEILTIQRDSQNSYLYWKKLQKLPKGWTF